MPVELRGVGHRFGSVVAISDVSFALPEGSLSGVIGPSGSGKTTTIRAITGGLAPSEGQVRVLGEEPRRFRRRTREQIGYLPQQFVLYPELTVLENVDFMASLYGLLGGGRRRRVHEVIRLVDLWDARSRRASNLSGGMQRRLSLACALVHRPRLLVLDEPTAGIDPLLRTAVWQELERLRAEGGVTVLVTTQYVTEAEYCDWVALISAGELVAWATPDDLRRQALGGDVLEVVTASPVDARALPAIEGVLEVRQTGPRELHVITDQAGVASPRVMDALDEMGVDVEYSRETRPTFDEVFAALVTRHAEEQQGVSTGGAGVDPTPVGFRQTR
ncbi:MAG TPA: ABC transporter ATP-binding protein [Candidatus Limnocylindria bacterium]|nr:ABC transporter ATP-binding protein [Candidatus Limnocylindria bacterium]